MRTSVISRILIVMCTLSICRYVSAEQAKDTIQLSTINWEPYSGEKLPDHGFFSELITEAFSRVGYRVEFKYRPWVRALKEAKNGDVHGVMNTYWTRERENYLEYSDVVWKVKEEFIALRNNPITYTGKLSDLRGVHIGALRASAQAEELQKAGIKVSSVNNQRQNIKKLLAGRIDAIIIPQSVFFHQIYLLEHKFDRTRIKVLKPAYKMFDMYVAFSKNKSNYAQLTADFDRGLKLIHGDGTYEKILLKHHISE